MMLVESEHFFSKRISIVITNYLFEIISDSSDNRSNHFKHNGMF